MCPFTDAEHTFFLVVICVQSKVPDQTTNFYIQDDNFNRSVYHVQSI